MDQENTTSHTSRYLLWGAVVLVVVGIIALIAYLIKPVKPAPVPAEGPSLPDAGSQPSTTGGVSSGSILIPISGGSSVATKDFLNDSATVSDPVNPGYYYLGYHESVGPEDTTATDAPPYVIEYIAATHYFNIGLYAEPIGQVRRDAEQYLLTTLGVSQDAACALKYMVSVPDKVNSYYSGQNLGFSFCPGAVQLPQ